MVAASGDTVATKGAKTMTRNAFLLTLAAFLASTMRASADPPGIARAIQNVPSRIVPILRTPPPRGGGPVRPAPAPLLGAGLPAILVAGAALTGYRLWRRKQRRDNDGA
jgi:hypothetical protein